MVDNFSKEKSAASDWFSDLREKIIQKFEALECNHKSDMPAGLFDLKETKRTASDGSDAGGGLMSVMRGGRVFEKVGINVSTVFGTLSKSAQEAMAARKDLLGMLEDPQFCTAGQCGFCICATSEMPAAQNCGSSSIPGKPLRAAMAS